ncbi:Phospholipase-like [Trema orientale]|uniref:Phospholipase-like n=1 Tax=Trema orientale TaxID=63057 RepID=A0A2P5FPB6_TREOI|nr:Phospholipase-like [Trema orientale]
MTNQKPTLGKSSSILPRRSERLQQRLGHAGHFGITTEKSECAMCPLAKTPFLPRLSVDKRRRTTRARSTKASPGNLKLGNEDSSNKQASYLSNTSTSKGKNAVNIVEKMLDPIWRGSFHIDDDCSFSRVDGLSAYNSTKACPEVLKVVCDLPTLLPSELLPRLYVWPESFSSSLLTDSIIDLYILPENESENKAFSSLLDLMTDLDLVIKIVLDSTTLMLASSRQLPQRNSFFPYQEENPSSIRSVGSIVPPNSANDAEAALGHKRSLKNLGLEDDCNVPDQGLIEGVDPLRRAGNEGLTAMETSTIFAHDFVELKVSPDTKLEEADRNRMPELVKCSEAPQEIDIDSGLTPALLRPRIPDIENISTVDSLSLQRQSIIHKPLKNSVSQKQKGNATHTQSICTSVLNMAHNFDDEAYEETTSVNNTGERVARYYVKPSLAPTLRAIVEVHGDIAQDCLLRSPEMLTFVLEKVCQVVQDFQALDLKDLKPHHMNSLHSAILDAELVKVDVKWLRNRHDELKEAVALIKPYNTLRLSRRKNMEAIVLKKKELMKLKSQVKALKCQISSLIAETESQDGQLYWAKSKCQRFLCNSLMDGLL